MLSYHGNLPSLTNPVTPAPMSLLTDIIFVKALRSSSSLISQLPAGDIYNTAITAPDEDLDNAPLPYVIVTFDDLQTISETKDDDYDSDEDLVHIGITVAAKTREQLGTLMPLIRSAIAGYFRDNYGSSADADFVLIPESTTMSASAIQYDPLKPCFWQTLTYACDTKTDL